MLELAADILMPDWLTKLIMVAGLDFRLPIRTHAYQTLSVDYYIILQS